jgi:hypothetical protein
VDLRRAARPRTRHQRRPRRPRSAGPARITDWISDGALALADLGYEGEPETFPIPVKKPKNGDLTIDQQTYNAIHGALRCLGERANSLIKTTYKALRRYRGCPWRLGTIVAAALVLLHHEHDRTT